MLSPRVLLINFLICNNLTIQFVRLSIQYVRFNLTYCVYSLHIVYFLCMEKSELKKRRERLGLKQSDFAETIGVTATTISRYETGLTPIPKNMDLVLEALEKRQIENLKQPITAAK